MTNKLVWILGIYSQIHWNCLRNYLKINWVCLFEFTIKQCSCIQDESLCIITFCWKYMLDICHLYNPVTRYVTRYSWYDSNWPTPSESATCNDLPCVLSHNLSFNTLMHHLLMLHFESASRKSCFQYTMECI